jgi:hypothetical protein
MRSTQFEVGNEVPLLRNLDLWFLRDGLLCPWRLVSAHIHLVEACER